MANLVDLRTEEGRGREAPRRASHREESEARLWLVMDLKENFLKKEKTRLSWRRLRMIDFFWNSAHSVMDISVLLRDWQSGASQPKRNCLTRPAGGSPGKKGSIVSQ